MPFVARSPCIRSVLLMALYGSMSGIRGSMKSPQTVSPQSNDNPYLLWQRNVKDELKALSNEEIKERLRTNSKPFAVMMQQIHSDFNFGTLVRNANNFGAREVFYYGERKRWNKSPARGTYIYTPVKHLKTIDEIQQLK